MRFLKYPLLNFVACPMCKNFPLKLYIFKEIEHEIRKHGNFLRTPCDRYCGYREKYVDQGVDKSLCVKKEVKWGLLYCDKCGRWFPIVKGVPLLYPDDIHLKTHVRKIDEVFIKAFIDKIPKDVISKDPLKLFSRYVEKG